MCVVDAEDLRYREVVNCSDRSIVRNTVVVVCLYSQEHRTGLIRDRVPLEHDPAGAGRIIKVNYGVDPSGRQTQELASGDVAAKTSAADHDYLDIRDRIRVAGGEVKSAGVEAYSS